MLTATVHAYASGGVPALLPFQGRATDTSGNPITSAATFKFRIYPPNGNCYIYEETQSITPNDFGFFSTVLGSAANSTGPANSFASVYSNQTTVPDSCATTYTPALGDWRRIEVVANGIPMSTMQTVASTPFSINSGMLDGLLSSDFLQTNGSASQSALNLLVSGQDASSLHNHDGLYAKLSGSNTLSGNTTTSGSLYAIGSASQIGIGTSAPAADLEIARSAPSVVLRATAGSGQTSSITFDSGSNTRARIESAENANTLRFLTGTNEAMLIDANQNITVDGALSLNKTLSLGRYNSATEPALLASLNALGSSATGTVWLNGDTNQLKFWNGSTTVALGAGMYVTSVGAGTGLITSGTASSPSLSVAYGTGAGMAVQGNAAFGGDIFGTYNSLSVVGLQGRWVSPTAPTSGQILKWNATTNMWEPSADLNSGGTLTSVVAGSGLLGGTITQSGTLSVDRGYAPNQIVGENAQAQIAQQDGSVVSPTYSFGNSPDTGLFSPGSGRLTFATSGTASLSINSAGNVGIGTTSPQYTLDVHGTLGATSFVGDASNLSFTGGTNNYLYRNSVGSLIPGSLFDAGSRLNLNTSSLSAQFMLSNTQSGSVAGLDGLELSLLGNQATLINREVGSLNLGTNNLTRVSIDANGQFGIGTATPAAILDVNGSAAQSAMIVPRDSTANRPTAAINGMIRYNSDTAGLETFANGLWQQIAAGTAVGSVQSITTGTGLLGGPITANGTLAVNVGTASGQIVQQVGSGQIAQDAGSYSAPAYAFVGQANTGLFSPSAGSLAISTNGATSTTFLPNGNVGVGTTNPSSTLSVNGTFSVADTNYSYLTASSGNLSLGSAALLGYISLPSSGAPNFFGTNGYTFNNATAGGFNFQTAGSSALTIAQSGQVGVGTSAPQAGFDIALTGPANSALIVPRDVASNRPLGVNGMIRYNTSANVLESFVNGSWQSLAAGNGVGTVQTIASGTGLLGGPISANGTLSVNVGTGALQIVQENNNAQILQASGLPGSPAYSFANSSGSGLFAPGVNQLALSTNGTTALTIASNGAVGIGTSSPSSLLQVNGNTLFSGTNANVSFDGNATFKIAGTNGASNASLSLGNDSGSNAIIYTARSGNPHVGDLILQAPLPATNNGNIVLQPGGASGVGGVVIGTFGGEPVSLLELIGNQSWPYWTTTGVDLNIVGSNLTDTTGSGAVNTRVANSIGIPTFAATNTETVTNAATLYIAGPPTAGANLSIVNPQALSVASGNSYFGGLVGIGTQSPSGVLDVYGTGSKSAVILPRDNTANRPAGVNGMIRYNTNTSALESFANGSWQTVASGTSVGTVQSVTGGTGLLGGTITNFGTLSVNVGTGSAQIVQESANGQILQASGSATAPTHSFAGSTGTGMYSPATNQLGFSSNGTTAMVINASGSLGIGTMNPAGFFDVEGGTAAASTPAANVFIVSQAGGPVPSGTNMAGGNIILMSGPNGTGGTGGHGGYVGVNTTNPNGLFNVVGESHFQVGSYIDPSVGLAYDAKFGGSNNGIAVRGQSYFANSVGVGTATPAALLDVYGTGSTSAIIVPRDSTANRPSGTNGMIRYNTSLAALESFANGSWQTISSGTSVGGLQSITGGTGLLGGTITAVGTLAVNVGTGALQIVQQNASGQILQASGSAIAPTHSFSNSTGTGMYSPGTGQLAFSTAGSSAMTISPAGLVGIGTTNPQGQLDVLINSPYSGLVVEGSAGFNYSARINLIDLSLGTVTTSPDWVMDNAADKFRIFRQPNLTTGGIVGLAITNAMNVGIGTQSPGGTLDVEGGVASANTDGNSIRFTAQAAGSGGNNAGGNIYLTPGTASGTGTAGRVIANGPVVVTSPSTSSGANLTIQSATSQRSTLNFSNGGTLEWYFSNNGNAGNDFFLWDQIGARNVLDVIQGGAFNILPAGGIVGIGTSSPGAALEVAGTGTANSAIIVPRDTTANRPVGTNGMIRYNTSLAALESFANGSWQTIALGTNAGSVQSITGGTGLLGGTITSNGTLSVNVGTGALQIVQENANGQILQASGSAAAPTHGFVGNTGTGMYSPAANQLGFSTNGTSAVTINGNGYVGIGTSSPSNLLHVLGSGAIIDNSNAPNGNALLLRGYSFGDSNQGGQLELYNTYPGVPNPGKYFRVNANGTLQILNNAYSGTIFSITDGGNQIISNATPATSTSNSISPSFALQGNFWNGSASNSDSFTFQNTPGTGSNPIANLSLTHSGSTGGTQFTFPSGNMGIGTTSPAAGLDVPGVYVRNGGVQINGVASDPISYAGASSPSGIWTLSGTGLVLKSAGINSLYVAGNNVGIGTSIPVSGLDVFTSGTASSAIVVPRDTTANRPAGTNGMIRYNTNLNAIENFANGAWQTIASGSGVGTVQSITASTGLLGGTISGVGTISVNVGTGAGQIVQQNANGQILQANGSAAAPTHSFAGSTGTGMFSPNSNQLAFATNGTTAITVNASGNVGLGTTAPITMLDVAGGGTFRNGGLTLTSPANSSLVVATGSGAFYGQTMYQKNANNRWGMGMNQTVESGSNSGSDFFISGWSDTGSFIGTPLSIQRSTGYIGLNNNSPNSRLSISDTPTDTGSGNYISLNSSQSASPTAASTSNFYGGSIGTTTGNANNASNLVGLKGSANHNQSGTVNSEIGLYGQAYNLSTGTVSNAYGGSFYAANNTTGTITSATAANFFLQNSGGGIINNGYGVAIGSIPATNKWSIYSTDATAPSYFAGSIGIGTSAPLAGLDVNSTGTISAIIVPRDTTANRPAGTNGMIRYNTNLAQLEAFTNGLWSAIATSASGSSSYLALSGGTMTGPIVHSNGTTSSPSMSFANDTTTGFYSPAAGSIVATTGGTARLTITSSGNVGIGTSNPKNGLDVTNGIAVGTYAGSGTAPSNGIISSGPITSGSANGDYGGSYQLLGRNDQNATTTSAVINAGTGSAAATNFYMITNTANSNASYRLVDNSGSPYLKSSVGTGVISSYWNYPNYNFQNQSGTSTFMAINSNGNVGIGTASPNSPFSVVSTSPATSGAVYGVTGGLTVNPGTTSTVGANAANFTATYNSSQDFSAGSIFGLQGYANHNTNATVGTSYGGYGFSQNLSTGTIGNAYGWQGTVTNSSTGTINNAYGLRATINNNSTGTIGTSYALWLATFNSGTITNRYGLYQSDSASTNYFAGNLGIGTNSPVAALDINVTGSTSAIVVPRDTTANRPTGTNGMIRYNTNLAQLETFANGMWSGVTTASSAATNFLALSGGTMSGAIAHTNGTLSAPSMTFQDLTTGFYSTGAGNISAVTAGTTRLSITPSGNVGIGTTNSNTLLQVGGSGGTASTVRIRSTAINLPVLSIGNNANTSEVFQAGETSGAGYLNVRDANNITQATFNASGVNYLNGGNVGIGTTAPAKALHVYGSSANQLGLQRSTAAENSILFSNANGNWSVGQNISGFNAFDFFNGSLLMTLLPTGNLGIGTNLPVSLLDVYGTGSNSAIIVPRDTTANRPTGTNGMIRYNTNTNGLESFGNGIWSAITTTSSGSSSFLALNGGTMSGAIVHSNGTLSAPSMAFVDTTTGFYSTGAGNITAATAGTARLTINPLGNLGVGTTNPSDYLFVQASSGLKGITINSPGGTGNAGSLTFSDPTVGQSTTWTLRKRIQGDDFGFLASGTSVMTLTASGNVGIGTSSPGVPLQVVSPGSTSYANPAYFFQPNLATGLYTSIMVGQSTAGYGATQITYQYNSTTPSASAAYFGLQGYATNALSVSGANGTNVGIGSAAAAYPLDVAGDIRTSTCLHYASSTLGTCSSDERLKKDIRPFDLGLDVVLGLKPKFFKFNGLGGEQASQSDQIGVIAQDVEKVAPSLVSTKRVKLNPDDANEATIKAVDYGSLIYTSLNAIRELYFKWFNDHQLIEQLDIRNQQLSNNQKKLERENETLKRRLEKLERAFYTH